MDLIRNDNHEDDSNDYREFRVMTVGLFITLPVVFMDQSESDEARSLGIPADNVWTKEGEITVNPNQIEALYPVFDMEGNETSISMIKMGGLPYQIHVPYEKLKKILSAWTRENR